MTREEIIGFLRQHFEQRIRSMDEDLRELREDNASNAKSTAGDDHDTEREMLSVEMESLSDRLDADKRVLHTLNQIAEKEPSETVRTGSIVVTAQRTFLLGLSFSPLKLKEVSIMGLSTASPLGQQLIGCKAGDVASLNGVDYKLTAIM